MLTAHTAGLQAERLRLDYSLTLNSVIEDVIETRPGPMNWTALSRKMKWHRASRSPREVGPLSAWREVLRHNGQRKVA